MAKQLKGQKLTGANTRTRPEFDFYTTPVYAVEQMLDNVFDDRMQDNLLVLDPCAGNGVFGDAIRRKTGWRLVETDIKQRECKLNAVGDFLTTDPTPKFDAVVMNPPYTQATEFILHALKWCKPDGCVVAFLKLDFLATRKRFDNLLKHGHLRSIWINVGRVTCYYNGDVTDKTGGSTETGWFLFKPDTSTTSPRIGWIE